MAAQIQKKRKRRIVVSSDSEEDEHHDLQVQKKRKRRIVVSSDSEEDEHHDLQDQKKRKRRIIVSSDSEEDEHRDLRVKNRVLFINDKGDVMHFLLQLRRREDVTRIRTLIQNHCGGVAANEDELGPHTIVLVDDHVLSWPHEGDVFKVSYVEKCINKGIILDISKFLKVKSRVFTSDFSFMDVVHFKKYSWTTVPSQYRLKEKSLSSDTDTDADTVCSVKKKRRPRGPPYSHREKEAILKYVAKHHAASGRNTLMGVALWRTMEQEKVCDRTWQSMKEHFIKILAKNLSRYKCISEKDKNVIRESLSLK